MDEKTNLSKTLWSIYHCLLAHYGSQHWWPAEDPLEIIIGAILTQSAAWGNVEKAITNLKAKEMLALPALRQIPEEELAHLIRSCGYYNAKATKIKSFVYWLRERYNDNLDRLFALDISPLRQELLLLPGIGEESADSIILYAARKPIFVIDAYTRRIVQRLGLEPPNNNYATLQELFMEHLPHDEKLFNEYHALFVRHGKEICRKVPRCEWCCLSPLCSFPSS